MTVKGYYIRNGNASTILFLSLSIGKALNMIKKETSIKESMNVKRQKACPNEGHLEKIIFG